MRKYVLLVMLIPAYLPTAAHAQVITIGPGDVTATAQDGALRIIAVDLTHTATLSAGSHSASWFNYQFSQLSTTGGTITPLVLTGGGTSFTPIAIGQTLAFAGPTAFVTVPFGGNNNFSLPSDTTVFAGVYFDHSGTGATMPVGYDGSPPPTESTFVRFGLTVNPPVLNVPISGGGSDTISRAYDFSLTLDSSVVPEPGLILVGTAGLIISAAVVCRLLDSRRAA